MVVAEIMNKKCGKCGISKIIELNFYKNGKFKNGRQRYLYWCIQCYQENNGKRGWKIRNKWKLKNTDKVKCQDLLRYAVRSNILYKPDFCFECKRRFLTREIQGHHIDYSKPLNVIWLCPACHTKIHKEVGQR